MMVGNLVRVPIAVLMTALNGGPCYWSGSKARRKRRYRSNGRLRITFWSRDTAWDLVVCDECGWRGPLRWATHGYRDDGTGEDVEPFDECPRCGQEVAFATDEQKV